MQGAKGSATSLVIPPFPGITMDLLDQFYEVVKTKENIADVMWLPHSSVFYVREALRQRAGITFDLKAVYDAMYELGACHPNDYGIPAWYQRKWMRCTKKRKPYLPKDII